MNELPGYIDESIEEKAKNESLEVRCESTSQVPYIKDENEQFLYEDIIASRLDYISSEVTHEQAKV